MSGLLKEDIELLKMSDCQTIGLDRLKNNHGYITAIYKEDNEWKNASVRADEIDESEYNAVVVSDGDMTAALEDGDVKTIFVKGTTSVHINTTNVNGSKYIYSDNIHPVVIKKLEGNYATFKIFCHSKFECNNINDIDPSNLYLTTVDSCDNYIEKVREGYVYEKYRGSKIPLGTREYWNGSGEVYVYPEPATKSKAGIVKVGEGLSVNNEGKISLDGSPFSVIKPKEDNEGNGITNIKVDDEDHALETEKRFYILADEKKETDDPRGFEAKETISFNRGYKIASVNGVNSPICIDASNYTNSGAFKVYAKLAFRNLVVDVYVIVPSTGINYADVVFTKNGYFSNSSAEVTSMSFFIYNKKLYIRPFRDLFTYAYDVVEAYITDFMTDNKVKLTFNEEIPNEALSHAHTARNVSGSGLIGEAINESSILTVSGGLISKIDFQDKENKLFVIKNGELTPLGDVGSVNNPIYIDKGEIKPINLSIPNNALISVQSGAFRKSNANVGSQGKFVYLSEGRFLEANAKVEVSQIINLDRSTNTLRANSTTSTYTHNNILPAEANLTALNPDKATVYIIGSNASLNFSSISSFGIGAVIEIFSKGSNNIVISAGANAKWIDGETSTSITKTIVVSKHATIIRLPNESNTMVFYIMNEEV